MKPRYKPRARILQFRDQHEADARWAGKQRELRLSAIETFLEVDDDALLSYRQSPGMHGWFLVWGEGNYYRFLDEHHAGDALLMALCVNAGRFESWDLDRLQRLDLPRVGSETCL